MLTPPFRLRLPFLVLLLTLASCASETSSPPPEVDAGTPLSPERAVPEVGPTARLGAATLEAAAAVESIDAMRTGLAATLRGQDTITDSTFARVCKPVGMQARSIAEARGWDVRQVSEKFRNPANAPSVENADLFPLFASHPDMVSTWRRAVSGEREGWQYARRIVVQESCLACHGPEDERPSFVAEGYPDDRAYGFEPGDLRGLYVVFVPDNEGSSN